jgi:hypothetical protein
LKKNVLAGTHKTFECCRITEMYLRALQAQDKGKKWNYPHVEFH